MPQKVKFHGATLEDDAIVEFYPGNPDFNYFLFLPIKDASGDYYLKVYAVDKNGNCIKEVTVSKDTPGPSIDFDIFLPAYVVIGTTNQLDKLEIPPGQKIKFIKLIPKKYKDNYVSFKVIINPDASLDEWDEEINPCPPGCDDNDW